ncbi:MAG: hypothetical protein JNK58_06595 [Phycisphaerae bacterium]|nr:hypothetical protein [Phycisphaerae bacterium]
MTHTSYASFIRPVLVAAMLTSAAPAAAPRVLSLIPSDGPYAAIAVDHLDLADARLKTLLTAVGGPGYAGLDPLLRTMGVRDGIDLTGSAALVLLPAGANEDAAALIILPTSDPEEFFAGVHAREQEGARAFDYAGSTYFTRTMGHSYIALSDRRDVIESFVPADGPAERHVAAFGPIGARLVDTADLVAIADPARAAALLNTLMSLANDGELDQRAFQEALRRDEAAPAGTILDATFLGRLMSLVRAESRRALLAISLDPAALRLEIASTFTPDGVLARASNPPKDAGAPAASPLAHMPAAPYLVAVGIDSAHHAVRALADELAPPGRSTRVLAQSELMVLNSIPSTEALAIVVYEPTSVMFGSLARTIVSWRAPAPEEGVRAFRAWVESLDQRPIGNAVVTARYQPAPGMDAWTITPPAGAMPMLPMLLGPAPDVQGTVTTQDGRAYLTWTRDAKLLESIAAMAAPDHATLDRQEPLARTSRRLPSPRVVEAYFDGSSAVKQLAPMLAGAHAAAALPEQLSPVAAAITVEDGTACLTLVAPADVLKALNVLGAGDPDREPSTTKQQPRPRPRRGPPREMR